MIESYMRSSRYTCFEKELYESFYKLYKFSIKKLSTANLVGKHIGFRGKDIC